MVNRGVNTGERLCSALGRYELCCQCKSIMAFSTSASLKQPRFHAFPCIFQAGFPCPLAVPPAPGTPKSPGQLQTSIPLQRAGWSSTGTGLCEQHSLFRSVFHVLIPSLPKQKAKILPQPLPTSRSLQTPAINRPLIGAVIGYNLFPDLMG